MSRRVVNKFDIDFAKKLYREKKSWQEMGRILGIHPYSVQYWFNNNGFPSQREMGQKRKWDVKLATKMRNEGKTYREIAEKMEVSITAVFVGIKKFEASNECNASKE